MLFKDQLFSKVISSVYLEHFFFFFSLNLIAGAYNQEPGNNSPLLESSTEHNLASQ